MKFLIFFVFFGLVLAQFGLFVRILCFQYRNFRKEWERLGKPGGFFWYPKEASLLSGSLKRGSVFYSWIFRTEEWMRGEPSVMRTLMVLRGCAFLTLPLFILWALLLTVWHKPS